MREFYFRDKDDPNYREDIVEVSDEVESLIYQIRMILGTNKQEVLGASTFGANLENRLFSFDLDEISLNSTLIDQTNTYSELARSYNVNFKTKKITDGKYRDAIVIDVEIDGKSLFGFFL